MGPDDAAHLAVILTADRERAIADLERSGVSTSIHFPIPDHRQPHLAGGAPAAPLPITEYACAHVLTIPLFPELHEDEVARICETLSRAPG